MEILSNFVAMFAFYCVGFLAGYFSQKERYHDIIKETKLHIKKLHKDDLSVGVIKRPTAEQLLKKTDPFEKKVEEGKRAMADTLSQIKELR